MDGIKSTKRFPAIPHVSVLPDGMFAGRAIVVKGLVLAGGTKRFQIDLCCGLLVDGDHTDNKALHFNPRFDSAASWFSGGEKEIIFNTLVNNVWGVEERVKNVFEVGQPFQLRILALTDYFKVAVNGKHLADYNHRVPVDSVQTIYISGAVQIDFIEFQGERLPSAPSLPEASAGDNIVSTGPILKPSVPFELAISGGFSEARKLQVTGTPHMDAAFFEINFFGQTEHFLHFKVHTEKQKVVRNNTKGGKWQQEEVQASHFPFITGATFDLVFTAQKDFYQITANGTPFVIFKYRNGQSPSRIDRISINGDIRLQLVELV